MGKKPTLRTVSAWAIYDPAIKGVINLRTTKKAAKELFQKVAYPGCIIVHLKGCYFPKSPAQDSEER